MSYAYYRVKQLRPDLYHRLIEALRRLGGESKGDSFRRMICAIKWEMVLRRKLLIPPEWP